MEFCDTEEVEITQNGRRSNASMAWEYFRVFEEDKKIASCKICKALLSYKTSVSNLTKHLRRKHDLCKRSTSDTDNEDEDETKDYETDLELLDKSDASTRRYSALWDYFKIIDEENRMAKCLLCTRELSYSSTQTNLRRHLDRKHPLASISDKSSKRILFSTGTELYELEAGKDDDEEPIKINEVFLKEFKENLQSTKQKTITIVKNVEPPKKKRRRLAERPVICDNDSGDETSERRRGTGDDSLEYFGKYVVALLRQLPKRLSNRLQADFVRQIMSAQAACDVDGHSGSAAASRDVSVDPVGVVDGDGRPAAGSPPATPK